MAHRKIHMPRHHDRLYPGWRLPLSSALKATEQRFKAVLEEQVRSSLHALVSKRQKTIYPDPNESTLLTLAASTSTLQNSVLSRIIEREVVTVQVRPTDGVVQEDSSVASTVQKIIMPLENMQSASCTEDKSCSVVATDTNAKSLPLNNTASTPLPEGSKGPRSMPLGETNDDTVQLVQGRTLSCNVAVGNKSPLYAAGSLETQIEYPVEEAVMLPHGTLRDIRYGLEWIAIEEAGKLMRTGQCL
jgi:hypothetical protein